MNVPIYSLTNAAQADTLEIPGEIFDSTAATTLIHQAVTAEAANLRAPHGHTKTRGDVSGGGRKPWKQKGTGRARQSSTRSPIWVGGGIAFGPKANRNFRKSMPVTMRTRAFQQALAAQLAAKVVRIVDDWSTVSGKTKDLNASLQKLPDLGIHRLLILEALDPKVVLAARNLPHLVLSTVASVRTTDLLRADTIITSTAGFQGLMQRAYGVDVELAAKKPTKTATVVSATEEGE